MFKHFILRSWSVICAVIFIISCDKDDSTNTKAEHVIIIGVDGMSIDGIKTANTPVLDSLMANGASTLKSRGVIPTSSGPNWASILMGAGPEEHGITNNSYNPLEPTLPPVVSGKGKKGIFPSVFEILHTQKPNWETGAIYHWPTIKNYYEEEHVKHIENYEDDDKVIKASQKYIAKKLPKFLFIHLDNVDHEGHSKGHGSKPYYKAVEKIDSLIGDLIHSLKTNKLESKTIIMVTADHGGLGFGHNENVPEVLGVPFIISGPNIKKGYTIVEPVNTIDTSPTALYVLGIDKPSVWTGTPIKSAFLGSKEPDAKYVERVFYRKPRFTPMQDEYIPAGGLFLDKKPNLIINVKNDSGIVVRYTLDGKEPQTDSKMYTDTLQLNKTTVVKASKFKDGKRVSNVNTAYYRVVEKANNIGVLADIYYGKGLDKLPDFNTMKPVLKSYQTYEFTSRGLKYPKGVDQVAVKFTSYLKVAREGEYTFYTESDDGSKLFINDKEVVDSDGNHGVRSKEGKIFLKKGKHKVNVLWYNSGGGLWLQTYIKGPNISRQVLTSQMPTSGLSLHTNR